MASAYKVFSSSHKSLEIKTKSIETTLVPLVTQISTLVNFKEKPRSLSTTNEKTLNAINRVGDAVHMAIERFVSVGRLIRIDILLILPLKFKTKRVEREDVFNELCKRG